MENVSIKINLAQLTHALMKSDKTGNDLLVIPIEDNNLFKSEKGNIYLDLIAFPVKTPNDDQTHIVKQSLPKAVRDAMTEEQKRDQPIFGNMKIWGDGPRSEPAPKNAAPGAVAKAADDLPF